MQRLLHVLGLLACAAVWSGEPASPDPAFKELGRLKLRTSKEIEASIWSVGAETMCRDYTIYKNWREYLGELGAKKARIQSGWAKTEKAKGQYDWAWLDEIIPDMVAQGVEPWMCVSYGNPIYEKGGTPSAKSPLPGSPEAQAAWDRFIKALGKLPWTEPMQAKWTLRRMLGDLGHDIESSYFSIMDMHYDDGVNRRAPAFKRQANR